MGLDEFASGERLVGRESAQVRHEPAGITGVEFRGAAFVQLAIKDHLHDGSSPAELMMWNPPSRNRSVSSGLADTR